MKNRKQMVISALLALSCLSSTMVYVQAQETSSQEGHVTKKNTPPKSDMNPLLNPKNPLGLSAADNNIKNTAYFIKNNNLAAAKALIAPTLSWLSDATEYHTNLYKTLKDIDTAKVQADVERELALKYALLRDKAAYQLAVVDINQNKLMDASDKLVDIVRSQPTTQLGFDAYHKLQDIGFTYKVQFEESNTTAGQQTQDSK